MLTIEESCFQNAKACPDKTAIVSGKKSVTYRELALAILAARKIYTALPNYKRGRAVVIAASKQPSFASAYFGAHLAGLIVVPIDPETNSTRFNHIMKIADPICAVGYKSECSSLLSLSLKSFDCFDAVDCEWNICYPKPDDVADIMFTTGTTGAPKGVVLTYANEAAAVRNINEYIGNLPEDVELLALPISHSFGLGRMRCCLANGQTLILQGSFANVKRLFRIMDEQSVTGFSMVPASWRFLQKMSGDKLSEYASQLRYVEMGSAYFSAEDKRHLAEILPRTRVVMHYGLTEASRSAFMEFHDDIDHLASVGKPSPHTDIRIMSDDGAELSAGNEGEICIRGEHVSKRYVNANANNMFHEDYLRTADWGSIDKDGYLSLKSRKKDLINVGGKKVSPNEVEEQLLKFDGVADCACIAVPDPNGVLGEVVKAYYVSSDNSEIASGLMTRYLTGKLEGYKIPAIYERIDLIPRTNNGKILRNQLA